jgi:hypothetical protein
MAFLYINTNSNYNNRFPNNFLDSKCIDFNFKIPTQQYRQTDVEKYFCMLTIETEFSYGLIQ